MDTFASYSTTKLLDPNAKKHRVKVISSKVQPVYRPKRPQCQTAGRTGHKAGKGLITEMKLTTAPGKKIVHFQETILDQAHQEKSRGKQSKQNFSTAQPSSEIRPPRSRNPVAQESAILKLNVDHRPSQHTEVRVPRQRSGIHRHQCNGEPTTKSSSFPVKNEHTSSRGARGAARSHAVCITNPKPRNMVPEDTRMRPTRERPVASAGSVLRPVQVTRLALLTDLNALRAPLLNFFKKKVSLSQEDISSTSDAVKVIVLKILDKVREIDERFGMKQLNTGSYYEKLKVSRPVEFDVMLVVDAHRIMRFFEDQYCREHPGYAKLMFKDYVHGGRELWGQFLTSDGKYLSPGKLVGRFYELVRNAVTEMRASQRKRVSQLTLNGPAVTLKIDEKIDVDLVLSIEVRKWPSCANGWGDFSTDKTWPTRRDVEEIKMKEPTFHLVAKSFPATKRGACMDSHLYWRISFSKAEKILLGSASPDKKYYRITKAICQAKKQNLEPLTSFHLKNLFLHNRSRHPLAQHDDGNLGESVVNFFQSLIDCLERGLLPHFFVSRANLFAEMSRQGRMNIARKLRGYFFELVQNPNRFLENLHL